MTDDIPRPDGDECFTGSDRGASTGRNVRQDFRRRALQMLEELPPDETQSLIIKCWMSHDARWFTAVAMAAGLETALRCNRVAIREEGRVEARRIARRLRLPPIRSVADFLVAQEAIIGLLGPDLLDYDIVERGEDSFGLVIDRCFAFDNVTRAGIASQYECGILPRVMGWLDGLEVEYELDPPPGKCLKAEGRACEYWFRLRMPAD